MEIVHRAGKIAFLTYDTSTTGRARGTPVAADVPRGIGSTTWRRIAAICWPRTSGSRRRHQAGLADQPRADDVALLRGPERLPRGVQVENFATARELRGYMESDAFAKNPIGVGFDPDALVKRYERRPARGAAQAGLRLSG
jgi:hypothetical protein